jgi:hypothetical protein
MAISYESFCDTQHSLCITILWLRGYLKKISSPKANAKHLLYHVHNPLSTLVPP